MAQKSPWTKVKSLVPDFSDPAQVEALMLAQTGPEQSSIGVMADPSVSAAPKDMVAPPKPSMPTPQTIKKPSPMPITSISESTKQTYGDPDVMAQAAEVRDRLKAMQEDRLKEEQSGIDKYESKLNKSEKEVSGLGGVDWRPLASMLDRFGDGSTYKIAENQMSKKEAQKAMQEKLQGMKAGLSKSQYDALKDQLDSYNSQINSITAEKKLQASLGMRERSQDRLESRDDDKDLMEFQKRIQPLEKVDNTVGELERSLGFNLDEYDPTTQSVRGEKADVPGVNLPMLGRINQATPEGRKFKSDLARLMNTVLKERSGAAVTESEEQRLLSEFANGRYKFNTEADLLNTLKSYQNLLAEDKSDVMAGFRPKVVSMYYDKKGKASNYKRDGGAKPVSTKKNTPTDAEIDSMTPEQLKQFLSE